MFKVKNFFAYREALGNGKVIEGVVAPILLEGLRSAAERAGFESVRDNHTAWIVEVMDDNWSNVSELYAFTWSDSKLRMVERLLAGDCNKSHDILAELWKKSEQ